MDQKDIIIAAQMVGNIGFVVSNLLMFRAYKERTSQVKYFGHLLAEHQVPISEFDAIALLELFGIDVTKIQRPEAE